MASKPEANTDTPALDIVDLLARYNELAARKQELDTDILELRQELTQVDTELTALGRSLKESPAIMALMGRLSTSSQTSGYVLVHVPTGTVLRYRGKTVSYKRAVKQLGTTGPNGERLMSALDSTGTDIAEYAPLWVDDTDHVPDNLPTDGLEGGTLSIKSKPSD